MERYRRGKAWRAKSGSVNVLSGAPFGYRYVRKTPESGARYEVVAHEAVLVAEMFRRYADDGASIADLRRWLTDQGVRTRTGKERWDRSVIWGMLRNPAYAGTAVFGKTQAVHEPAGLNRTARLAGRTVPRQVRVQDRPREEWTGIPVPALVGRGDVRPGAAAAGRQQAVRLPQHEGPVPAAGHRRLRVLRLRLLPHHHDHHRREQDLLLPVPRLRRLPLPGRPRLPATSPSAPTTPTRSSGTTSRPCSPTPPSSAPRSARGWKGPGHRTRSPASAASSSRPSPRPARRSTR